MLNFVGVTENFAVIENVPYSVSWKFFDTWTGDSMPLDGMTFSGRIFADENGREIEMDIAKSDATAPGFRTLRVNTLPRPRNAIPPPCSTSTPPTRTNG